VTPLPSLAYKILTGPQMSDFLDKGSFSGAPVDLADGYIHLSAEEQLAGTLDKHFVGQPDLWIAKVDLTTLEDAVRWEESRGGALFPHLYAELPLASVRAYGPLARDESGGFKLPG